MGKNQGCTHKEPASCKPVPDNSATRAVAPPGWLLSAGRSGPASGVLRNTDSLTTRAGTTGFPHPASPHHSAVRVAGCWGHLPQYPCYQPCYRAGQAGTRGTRQTFGLASRELSWIMDHFRWGSRALRAHGAPQRTRCNGSGHLFPFSHRRGPQPSRRKLNASFGFLLSMVYDRPLQESPPVPPAVRPHMGCKGCWLLRGRDRNRGTALLPLSV